MDSFNILDFIVLFLLFCLFWEAKKLKSFWAFLPFLVILSFVIVNFFHRYTLHLNNYYSSSYIKRGKLVSCTPLFALEEDCKKYNIDRDEQLVKIFHEKNI